MAETTDLRTTGERIEALLDASAAYGPVARERAEELVRLVVELYGAGLERVLEIVDEAEALSAEVLSRLADDDLVAGLLLVHGLHPYDVTERVEQALTKVRPYLGSHGGNVELLEVSDDGVVRLRMLGSCDGCASSAVTLKLAVEGAIEAAAPEVVRIDVDTAAPDRTGGTSGVIPVDALTARLHAPTSSPDGDAVWVAVDDAAAISPGVAHGRQLAGLDLVIINLGGLLYAYRDVCGSCGSALAGAPVERRLGSGRDSAVLTCRSCHGHFAVAQAGRGLDGTSEHLDPLPLLEQDGRPKIAIPRRSRREQHRGPPPAGQRGMTEIPAGPLAVLQRIRRGQRPSTEYERCEMCGEMITDEHSHVVNLRTRSIMCACRACYLLFTAQDAALAYRAVPDRYLSFPSLHLEPAQWDELQIPVGVAFFFANSQLGRTVALYPGPAGATESELPLGAWEELVSANQELTTLLPDVEAILVRRSDEDVSCHLVPIDACYQLVGQLRQLWRGFDGGRDAREALDRFFDDVVRRSRPAQPGASRSGSSA